MVFIINECSTCTGKIEERLRKNLNTIALFCPARDTISVTPIKSQNSSPVRDEIMLRT